MSNKKWLIEYEAFLNEDSTPVPKDATEKVFVRMQDLINPSAAIVFFKVFLIHLAVGFLSLRICHQFGMNPFNTESSLADWLMAMWGHHICMIVCGTLFLSASILSAGYFLSIEEVKALRRTEVLQTAGLAFFSLIVFAAFGTEIALGVAGLWLFGALAGGFIATEVVWVMKRV